MNAIKKIVYASMFSILSLILQLMPFWPTTWGMRIDLVAVPWFIALFLFGLDTALLSLAVSSILISLVAPESVLGAFMKFSATVVMLVPLGLVRGRFLANKKNPMPLLTAFGMSLVIRCIIMVLANYYIALPMWLSAADNIVTPQIAMQQVPAYWIIIPNILQGIIDFGLAWILVFSTKLQKKVEP